MTHSGCARSDAALRRSLWIIAAVTAITAWFSTTFFHPDEHYQVLELMSLKLGTTPAADLPWEFSSRIRSWFQPFVYFLIAKPLIAAGLKDLFDVVFVLRVVTGCFSLAALCLFARAMLASLEAEDERFFYAASLPLLGFLPYLFVRTSSETFSGALFTAGMALLMRRPAGASPWRFIAAGLLCGASFEARFSSALMILGLFFWLAVIGRASWRSLLAFAAANAAVVILEAPIDFWGYGAWTFPPWNYLRVNLLENVAAERFGTDPFYSYPYLLLANIFLPVGVVIVASLFVACARNPKHVVTWVTLPLVVVQSAIAHKEERFLFPLAIIATSYPVLAFAPSRPLLPALSRVWAWRYSIPARAIAGSAVAAMLLLALYPYGFGAHMPMARYLYRNFPSGLTAYSFDHNPFLSYPMYRPKPFRYTHLDSPSVLPELLRRGPVYLFSETPVLASGILQPGEHAVRVYSELPFSQEPGIAALGTRFIRKYRALDRRILGLKLPYIEWMTLFRIEPAPQIANLR